jgi:uncharacterized protein YdeI (YjbR/CyaY-like superfamily)
MPKDVAQLLSDHRLVDDYNGRPHYQRNDYLGWIRRAKRPETRSKRIEQMLHELRVGGLYMKMDHPPSAKR